MVKSKARLLALFSALTISCINGVFERTLLAQEVANSDHATTKLTQQILKQKLIETCAENSLPGIWAGRFSTKSQPAIVEAAGIRKWDTPEQVDGDDTVHLGSCTKAMTSVIIGQLCTEGKLRLDSTLGEVFSDTAAVTETGWSEVTIQQLLQH